MEMTRRNVVEVGAIAAGVAALGGGVVAAHASESQGADQKGAPSELTGWAGTPEAIAKNGGSTMPLADLNAYRKAYVDAQTEFVCEDGRVISAPYVKMRALIHTYGQGSGNETIDFSFEGITKLLTEEEAQAYIEMPYGVRFSAMDFQAQSGRSLEECTELCEHIANVGYLERYETSEGIKYHQIGYFQGTEEYPFNAVVWGDDPDWLPGHMGADHNEDFGSSGTPNFYTVPCSKDVLKEGEELPLHDDIEKFIRGKSKYAVAPCLCRWLWVRSNCPDVDQPAFEDFLAGGMEEYVCPEIGHRVETCLQCGDEAEYWIYKEIGRAHV